jgi:hypothetical protein
VAGPNREALLVEVDLTPIEMDCMRCGRREPMRFYGVCAACREQLCAAFDRDARRIEVAGYEPKMNVTPNAVALKGD